MPQIKMPYTVPQVAKMCGKSESFVRKEIKEGRLRARHKKGNTTWMFITEADLKDWVEKGMWG